MLGKSKTKERKMKGREETRNKRVEGRRRGRITTAFFKSEERLRSVS